MVEIRLSGLTLKGEKAAKAAEGVLLIAEPGDYILTGKSDEAAVEIRCEAGPVRLTVKDVFIDMSERRAPALLISSGAGVELSLSGVSTLYGGAKCAAIQNGMRPLTICGGGELHAYGGGDAAGIGGTQHEAGGSITICGGRIRAYGGFGGAGIGGGIMADGENIAITGGEVFARGGRDLIAYMSGGMLSSDGGGAGIGGGQLGDAKNIAITGGAVDAKGGEHAAGIGGGVYGDAEGIVISGGEVEAHGGADAEDIGCGAYAEIMDLRDDDGDEDTDDSDDKEAAEYDESDGF